MIEIIIATAFVATAILCGIALECARREDKQNEDILNRIKELEMNNKTEDKQ